MSGVSPNPNLSPYKLFSLPSAPEFKTEERGEYDQVVMKLEAMGIRMGDTYNGPTKDMVTKAVGDRIAVDNDGVEGLNVEMGLESRGSKGGISESLLKIINLWSANGAEQHVQPGLQVLASGVAMRYCVIFTLRARRRVVSLHTKTLPATFRDVTSTFSVNMKANQITGEVICTVKVIGTTDVVAFSSFSTKSVGGLELATNSRNLGEFFNQILPMIDSVPELSSAIGTISTNARAALANLTIEAGPVIYSEAYFDDFSSARGSIISIITGNRIWLADLQHAPGSAHRNLIFHFKPDAYIQLGLEAIITNSDLAISKAYLRWDLATLQSTLIIGPNSYPITLNSTVIDQRVFSPALSYAVDVETGRINRSTRLSSTRKKLEIDSLLARRDLLLPRISDEVLVDRFTTGTSKVSFDRLLKFASPAGTTIAIGSEGNFIFPRTELINGMKYPNSDGKKIKYFPGLGKTGIKSRYIEKLGLDHGFSAQFYFIVKPAGIQNQIKIVYPSGSVRGMSLLDRTETFTEDNAPGTVGTIFHGMDRLLRVIGRPR